jgi:hypothetical protein
MFESFEDSEFSRLRSDFWSSLLALLPNAPSPFCLVALKALDLPELFPNAPVGGLRYGLKAPLPLLSDLLPHDASSFVGSLIIDLAFVDTENLSDKLKKLSKF